MSDPLSGHLISKWWWRAIALLLSTAPPAMLVWFQDFLAPHLALLSSVATLKLIAGLLLTTLGLLAYALLQRPWLRWDESTGTWISHINALRYCAKCKATKIVTPLKNEVTGWRCMNCHYFFHDPARAHVDSPKKKVTGSARI